VIAISYRREDSLPLAGRLYDRLQAEFGKGNVFMDFDSIPYGVDFRDHIKHMIDGSRLVIALIGPDWFGGRPGKARRIDDPADFVRLEIAYALQRGVPVIPVLINDTRMPKAKDLPSDIERLAFRNALTLDAGIDFHHHTDRLIAGINRLVIETARLIAAESRKPETLQLETPAPPVPRKPPLPDVPPPADKTPPAPSKPSHPVEHSKGETSREKPLKANLLEHPKSPIQTQSRLALTPPPVEQATGPDSKRRNFFAFAATAITVILLLISTLYVATSRSKARLQTGTENAASEDDLRQRGIAKSDSASVAATASIANPSAVTETSATPSFTPAIASPQPTALDEPSINPKELAGFNENAAEKQTIEPEPAASSSPEFVPGSSPAYASSPVPSASNAQDKSPGTYPPPNASGIFQLTREGGTFVWNNYPRPGDEASWSGDRDAEGYATGNGSITWFKRGIFTTRYTGRMIRGKLDGSVTNEDANGKKFHGTFSNGVKSADWSRDRH
jgi:hypothetical protein